MALEPFQDKFPRVHPSAFVHPAATLIGDVEIGPESSIWPGAVLRGDWSPIRIGRATSVQENTVVHVSPSGGTTIGDYCIVGHLALLEECEVGDECLVGVGARILNGSRMRSGSVAAAQTVLLGGMDVPRGHRAQGVPAAIVPAGRPAPEKIRADAESYVELANRMRESVNVSIDRPL
jgi:carbonic anhydrase/acetyltransferase-like protein (isoleucine patch superfamily)